MSANVSAAKTHTCFAATVDNLHIAISVECNLIGAPGRSGAAAETAAKPPIMTWKVAFANTRQMLPERR